MAQVRDPYEILGVGKTANADEIKKAYRKLARQHHPDRTGGDDTRFKELNAAHAVIGDEDKRKLFDEFGYSAFRPGFDAAQARAYGGAMRGGAPGGDMDLDELLRSMFGGGGGGGGSSFSFDFGNGGPRTTRRVPPRGPRRGRDIEVPTQVSLLEAIRGTEASFMLPDGNKIKVRIPPGVRTGSAVRLRGKGGPGADGGPAGDILLNLEVLDHPLVRVDRDDLEMDLPITFAESLRGGGVTVLTPTGTVKVKLPAAAPSGTRLRLKGRGLPRGGKDTLEGDLYLVLRPTPPTGADPDAVEAAAAAMEALYSTGPREDIDLG